MAEVIMPKMGDAMEFGTLLQWLVSAGDEVSEGDQIAEIETDKVTLELEAEDSGTLHELYASEGQDVPVGEAIAVILAEGEEPPARSEGAQSAEAAAEGGEEESTASTTTTTQEEPPAETSEEQPVEPAASGEPQPDGHFRASPIVRRLARENDLDLSRVDGSGPQGRIVERDVRAAMERGDAQVQQPEAAPEPEAAPQQQEQPEPAAAASAPAAAAAPEPTGAPGAEVKEIPRMQRVIGERMQQSKRDVPHFYATVEAEVDELMALRKRLNDSLAEEGVKLSVNDFVMKACAVALRKFPNLNALYTSEGIEQHSTVNLAMAVALEAGLITPVVRDAANKPLSGISSEAKSA